MSPTLFTVCFFLMSVLTCLARVLRPETSILSYGCPTATLAQIWQPLIANGYIGLLTGTPSGYMYINGVFNGVDQYQGGSTQNGRESHRAFIPSTNSMMLSFPQYVNSNISTQNALDLNSAIFSYFYNYSDANVQWSVTQNVFCHRLHRNLIVTEIIVDIVNIPDTTDSNTNTDDFTLLISVDNIAGTPKDVNLTKITNNSQCNDNHYLCQFGTTQLSEANASLVSVALLSFENNTHFALNVSESTTFVYPSVALTSLELSPEADLVTEMLLLFNELLATQSEWKASHVTQWEELWTNGRIDIFDSNSTATKTETINMASAVYASLYCILSAVRTDWKWGITPGGLANAYLRYHGHVFWDQEVFVFPSLLLLHNDPNPKGISNASFSLASSLIDYRYERIDGAVANAVLSNSVLSGNVTLRYPWESAFSGIETNNADEWNGAQEIHLSASVAFALNEYFRSTRNRTWLKEVAWPMLSGIANFFFGRVNSSDGMNGNTADAPYGYYDVSGPDEGHPFVNNSGFTNFVALKAIGIAVDAAESLNVSYPLFWRELTYSNTVVLYDTVHNYHPEFYGYQYGEAGGDIVFMGYPFGYYELAESDMHLNGSNASATYLSELLAYFSWGTTAQTMQWTQFVVGFQRLNEAKYAEESFYNLLIGLMEWNVSSVVDVPNGNPFKIWSEGSHGSDCDHFVTSAGGFSQTFLYGFAGLNLEDEYLEINVKADMLLWDTMDLIGVDYQYNQFDLRVFQMIGVGVDDVDDVDDEGTVVANITVTECLDFDAYGLVLALGANQTRVLLNVNETVSITKGDLPARVYNQNHKAV